MGYNVDVPVAVPRAVPREIVQHKHVPKPYEVAVPRAVPVPAPYKVHPVQEIVETPHIHHATVETHSTQAVVTSRHPRPRREPGRRRCHPCCRCLRRCSRRRCWIRLCCRSCCCCCSRCCCLNILFNDITINNHINSTSGCVIQSDLFKLFHVCFCSER